MLMLTKIACFQFSFTQLLSKCTINFWAFKIQLLSFHYIYTWICTEINILFPYLLKMQFRKQSCSFRSTGWNKLYQLTNIYIYILHLLIFSYINIIILQRDSYFQIFSKVLMYQCFNASPSISVTSFVLKDVCNIAVPGLEKKFLIPKFHGIQFFVAMLVCLLSVHLL